MGVIGIRPEYFNKPCMGPTKEREERKRERGDKLPPNNLLRGLLSGTRLCICRWGCGFLVRVFLVLIAG